MEKKYSKRRRSQRILAVLFGAVILALSWVFLQNSLHIYEQSRGRTKQYLIDITYQLHEHIETQIQNSLEMLRLIRNGALEIEPEERERYLADLADFSSFNSLHLVNDFDQAEAWLRQHYGGQYVLDRDLLQQGQAQLIAIPGKSMVVYFTADHADQDTSVIIGEKGNELLKELLSNNSFDGQALTLTITRQGTVITSQIEQNFFDEIAASYAGTEYAEVPQLFEKMRADLRTGQSGTLSFPSRSGESLLLSYEPLSFSDWCVFTVIPASVLNAGIEDLTMQNLVLTLVTILLLVSVGGFLVILQRKHTRRLTDIAFMDEITGGWNELRFRLEAEQILKSSDAAWSIASVDIADFTFLNNIYGTQAGDAVLRHVFAQIRDMLQPGEIAARSSADIFYILLQTQDRDAITRRLSGLKRNAEAFTGLDNGSYRFELRAGVYLIHDCSRNLAWMEESANLARKYRDGQECSFYREERMQEQKLERELISDMPSSLRSGAFEVYLQPKVRLSDGCISGAEALIRWNHPEKGMLSPGIFIPILEKAKMISRLDHFMFEQVCLLLQRWQQESRETCVISVNLSRQNLSIPDLLQQYRAICERYGVAPSSIELELTESIFMENTAWMQKFVQEMHQLGFRCSLDDFGAGYSSLGLLKDLDIDVIKLDRSFFAGNVPDGGKGRLIVSSILNLAQQLHIHTVAEGIEQTEQVSALRRMGCDVVQGFVFFRPMPVADFEQQAYNGGKLRCLPCTAAEEPNNSKEPPSHE